jgi:hypothetical protein
MPAAENPAQMAMARARSLASRNTFVTIDNVAGIINAAPRPMKLRVAMSAPAVEAKAEATDPSPKITRPAVSAPRRPNRSPRLPIVSRRPAKTSV